MHMRATRATIHLGSFSRNIAKIRAHVGPEPLLLLPIKADAYGHGARRMAQLALEAGVSHLAVATADEGELLRESGIEAPILLLSIAIPEEFGRIADSRLEPLCADMRNLRAIESAARSRGTRIKLHLKVDTGMGRIGCRPEEALELAEAAAHSRFLALGGLCTHFPVSDSDLPGDEAFTRSQIARFADIAGSIRGRGIDPGIVSAANSGAVLKYPEANFGMVRPGILFYGYYPAPLAKRPFEPEPVMELVTKIVYMKRIAAGESVSYGRTWTAGSETTIATLPVGYADGYPRAMSNKGRVRIRGKSYPVVGRVCMDQMMVDLGPAPEAELYDDAVLFGPGEGTESADDIAKACGTIAYEITCNINKRVPRVYEDS
jgi:alanine racemase